MKLHDWLNLTAAFGVLAGLILVAMEIRQSNDLANAESLRELWVHDNQIDMFAFENGVLPLIEKSINDPLGLTDEEIIKLDVYLSMEMQHQIMVANMRDQFGEFSTLELQSKSIVEDVLSGPFSRGWFYANQGWLEDYHPALTAAVNKRLSATGMDAGISWPSYIRENVRRVVGSQRDE